MEGIGGERERERARARGGRTGKDLEGEREGG
jgi:hypothetical protein